MTETEWKFLEMVGDKNKTEEFAAAVRAREIDLASLDKQVYVVFLNKALRSGSAHTVRFLLKQLPDNFFAGGEQAQLLDNVFFNTQDVKQVLAEETLALPSKLKNGTTRAHLLALAGQVEELKTQLLQRPRELNAVNIYYHSILFFAFYSGSQATVDFVLNETDILHSNFDYATLNLLKFLGELKGEAKFDAIEELRFYFERLLEGNAEEKKAATIIQIYFDTVYASRLISDCVDKNFPLQRMDEVFNQAFKILNNVRARMDQHALEHPFLRHAKDRLDLSIANYYTALGKAFFEVANDFSSASYIKCKRYFSIARASLDYLSLKNIVGLGAKASQLPSDEQIYSRYFPKAHSFAKRKGLFLRFEPVPCSASSIISRKPF